MRLTTLVSRKQFGVGEGRSDIADEIISCNAQLTAEAVNARYVSLTKDGTPTYYQVGTAKKFKITRISYKSDTAAKGAQIGYGDDAKAAGIVAPTNAISLTAGNFLLACEIANKKEELDTFIHIPAGKYPYLRLSGDAALYTFSVQITGIEVDV